MASKPYKIDKESWLRLGHRDNEQGTIFIIRMLHHDILIGQISNDYYADIEDAKKAIAVINQRLELRGS